MKINVENCPFRISEKLVAILEKEIEKSGVDASHGVIINFRDPDYSAREGGYHPVEIMIGPDNAIHYITDFAYVGTPPYQELSKEIDFDFSAGVFGHLGQDYKLGEGIGLFQVYMPNFCTYYASGVYKEIKVSPL